MERTAGALVLKDWDTGDGEPEWRLRAEFAALSALLIFLGFVAVLEAT